MIVSGQVLARDILPEVSGRPYFTRQHGRQPRIGCEKLRNLFRLKEKG
jgi:hypothetical protein